MLQSTSRAGQDYDIAYLFRTDPVPDFLERINTTVNSINKQRQVALVQMRLNLLKGTVYFCVPISAIMLTSRDVVIIICACLDVA